MDIIERNRDEEYARRLEAVVYDAHEMFWYGIGTDARVSPFAHIDDDRRLAAIAIRGRSVIEWRRGPKSVRIRKGRTARGRIFAIYAIALTFLAYLGRLALDILEYYGVSIAGG